MTEWNVDADRINKHVDKMVEILETRTNPVACKAIDMVFRPYMIWLHSAHMGGIDATSTRNSALHLMNAMIQEITQRMNDEKLGIDSAVDWLDEYMKDLVTETEEDLRTLYARKELRRAAPDLA